MELSDKKRAVVVPPTPFFIKEDCGKNLFVLMHKPEFFDSSKKQRAVIIIPPFAEELNKSRRMLSLLGQGLAERGLVSLLPDLFATGESDGELEDASMDIWLSNLELIFKWVKNKFLGIQVSILGLRLGAILAAEFANRISDSKEQPAQETPEELEKLIFWQPVTNTETYIKQFLRLKTMSEVLVDGKSSTNVSDLLDEIASGKSIEVAGYMLSSKLINSINRLKLGDILSQVRRKTPIDIYSILKTRDSDSLENLSPAMVNLLKELEEVGYAVEMKSLNGAQFWQTQEISELPELIEDVCMRFGA